MKHIQLTLRQVADSPALTVEGELNKLASNISIGRNMVGVHYFSDYIDSIRLGELVAIGILEEQALMYNSQQFPFSMAVPLFDGGTVVIGTVDEQHSLNKRKFKRFWL